MDKSHTIIWDWNGTLLDDMDLCIRSMNRMLEKRGLAKLDTERYRQVFTFPVKEYYQAIGFDFNKEDWDIAAHEFIYLYLDELAVCGLASGAIEALQHFHSAGYRQAIISAMQHDALLGSVRSLGIEQYLDFIGGIGDHYAGGKIENARKFFAVNQLLPENATLIGDTLHDAEVADELNCRCILVAAGHQSAERLRASGKTVVKDLFEAIEMIKED